ncbi:MAG: hypothetical protein O2923_10830 [Verrucomicrobia bacterium]|nr:hypothetical protein [Verrucomicrobiota bacterium]MDA1087123.1 hypothetical protein [Verrucomicrobiota bacterium]
MRRREFIGSIAAGVAAVGVLPQITSAAATALEQLRSDISTGGESVV